MKQQKYAAKAHVGSDWKAPVKSAKNGLCLSGGGSRALSAGLGQLIGLKSLSNGNGGTLLDSVDYISSVSGGTWLTSIFTYSENQNLDDLLGVYAQPGTLTERNIGDLPDGSIGHVPSKLSFSGMIDTVHEKIGLENIYKYPEVRKWMWPVIVGDLVLKPYNLYQGTMVGSKENITPMPERFFSLDKTYMQTHIQSLGGDGTKNSTLSEDDFYFHQSGRPFPIMNTNIKLDLQLSGSALLPVQGTPIAIGATGTASQSRETLTADGGVDSFAFTSNWQSQTCDDVLLDIDRRYSLIDLVSCSSAFFAEILGQKITSASSLHALGNEGSSAKGSIKSSIRSNIKEEEEKALKDLSSLIPQYNFWPVGQADTSNQNTGFADGGNLDNTGILGMLARSDATNLVVCYNSELPLGDKENISIAGYAKKVAHISSDIPILFGFQPSPVNGQYVLMDETTPADLQYLKAAHVFESNEFGPLVTELFSASNGQKSPTIARTKSLKVHDNSFAGINNRGHVDVLWLYNNYASDWVTEIHKNSWELADNISFDRKIPLTDFHNFPNYSTGLQIDLNATQVNALAQFQAWIVNQVSEQIIDVFDEHN